MSEWVAVCADENEEPVEIPTESDGSLLLTSVTAQFPGATGLKYRNPETNTLRGVRLQEQVMLPPTDEGWGMYTYICVRVKESPKKDEARLKRKTDSDVDMYSKNIKVDDEDDDDPDKTVDLIILGLPWKTSEEDIREYFEVFGEILMVQLKKSPGSGESKGYAFIRFVEKEVEKKVLLQRHMIDGRWCDIKIPDSQENKMNGKDKSSCKIFVGRVTEAVTKEDLRDHFEAFGQVTDVYIPTPFRHFAFVQFSESKVAMSLLGKEHIIKGVSVKIGEANPKGRDGGGPGGPGGPGGRGQDHRGGAQRFGGFGHPMRDGAPPTMGYGGQQGYSAQGGYGAPAGWGQPPLPGQYSGGPPSYAGSSYGSASSYGTGASYGGAQGGFRPLPPQSNTPWSNQGQKKDMRY